MKKIYLDILREIKKSLGRFLSIFAIVAIGVAFFAGIKASSPLMKETADKYFDTYNLQDIQIYSTLGFVEEDIDKIREIEGVEGVYATHSIDALFKLDTVEYVYKVMTLPQDMSKENKDYINQAVLLEGRLPENENECVVEQGKIQDAGVQIGDVIELSSGTDKPIEDSLNSTKLTVVGKVKSPYYLSYQKGSSNIGDGSLDGFLLVFDDNFKEDIYTEVYVTVNDAKKYNSYEDAYFDDVIKPIEKKINQLGNERASLRTEEVKKMALEEFEKNELEFESQKESALSQLEQAKQQLQQGYEQLIYNENKIKDMYSTIELVKAQGSAQIEAARSQLALLEAQLSNGGNSTQVELLKDMLSEVNRQIEALPEEDKVLTNETYFNLKMRQQSLELMIEISTSEAAKEKLLEAIRIQKENIDTMESELNKQIASYETQIAEGEKQIQIARAQYDAGVKEFENSEKVVQEQLNDAEEKLNVARHEIENMDEAEWIVLDRHSHYSYMDYGNSAERMDSIAQIFPLFFFLVAALICLTTMTRMVDEQRSTIGTLKALGYTKGQIAARYLGYAFISSLLGSIVGVFIGFAVFPTLIVHLWNMMYTVPDASFTFYWDLAILASLSCMAIVLAATYFAVNHELKETPALLMRPKAPSNGKRIFLERIDFIWSRLTFTYKVTCRNIFRYKKRFFMTIIGISGCTALLVAGYGIQDSISGIISTQYEQLQRYDASVKLSDDLNVVEKEEIVAVIKENENVEDLILVNQVNGSANIKNKDQSISMIVVEDELKFQDFQVLRNRKSHEVVDIPESGVLLSEKAASDMGVKEGDLIRVSANDMNVELRVEGIFENYVGHMIVMNATTYKDTFGLTSKPNYLYLKEANGNEQSDSLLGSTLTSMEGVESVSFFRGTAQTFQDMISSLSIVVVVLVISAGLLAFVVLYNLTNVNVSERIREIATLKVLGFYDKEVSRYVFRENILLSLIGSLAGLLLGTGLHRMIMALAEMDNVMFGRIIEVKSYVLGFIITMFFSWIVARVMYYKLKKIPMVESLKSVE